jgi:hypothetical protein
MRLRGTLRKDKIMNADEIYAELKRLAPHVAFSTTKSFAEEEQWEGDGDDPADEGFYVYDVEVTAKTIHQGKLYSVSSYIGDFYMHLDEPIGDIAGYLPQKLEEVVDLIIDIKDDKIKAELLAVRKFLKKEIQQRYSEQMEGRESRLWAAGIRNCPDPACH